MGARRWTLMVLLALTTTVGLVWWSTTPRPDEVAPSPDADLADLADAVARSLAAGTVRVEGTMTSSGGGPPIKVDGATALDRPLAETRATLADGTTAEVRLIGDRAWVRTNDGPWTPIDAGGPALAATTTGWDGILRALVADPDRPRRGSERPALLHGQPARIWLDAAGRIGRIDMNDGRLVQRLSFRDYGVALTVSEPPTDGP